MTANAKAASKPTAVRATFGQMIRAARIGFHWSTWLRCFVKLEEHGDDRLRVALRAADNLPSTATGTSMRVCWNGQGADAILRQSPALQALSGEAIYRADFVIDNAGCRIGPMAAPEAGKEPEKDATL